MSEKFKIYVVAHKEIKYKLIQNYIPIQVGKEFTKNELPYICDNTGDNISAKNNNYCELTAIYWIWKNVRLPQYIGIVHYRRYFVYGITSKLLDEKKANEILSKYDVILPYKYNTKKNVYKHFIDSDSGREKDLKNLRKIIKMKFPNYLDDYDEIMKSQKASYCNMMVLTRDNYKKYCEWLFNILFELEKITDLTGYTKQERRIYGFLSEFLLNVWVRHNNLKVKYCNMYYIENNKVKNMLKKVKLGLRSIFFNSII